MELRHLRCFVAIAEELHFARAAERLHIEQSPLSRTIKELEYHLGVRLFERTTRRTQLTWAGKVLLEEAHRVFAAIDQVKVSVKVAATGYHGRLRIALSDGIAQPRLSALLAQCRDQQLIGGGGKGLGYLDFGREVKDALQQRADFLAEQGLVEKRGQRVILARNLLATLRNRELVKTAQDIASATGLEHRPVADGQRVAGIYRRSIMLASGRYAMLDDGIGCMHTHAC